MNTDEMRDLVERLRMMAENQRLLAKRDGVTLRDGTRFTADEAADALTAAQAQIAELRAALAEALGYDPSGFIAEARGHLKDMPKVIQRDYLRIALEKLERVAAIKARLS